MGSKRRNHSPEFKTQVALQALNGQKTLAEIANIYEVHPVQVCQWKQQLVTRLPEVYRQLNTSSCNEALFKIKHDLAKLEVTNDKLNQEIDWLKKKLLQLQSEHVEISDRARQSTYLVASSM